MATTLAKVVFIIEVDDDVEPSKVDDLAMEVEDSGAIDELEDKLNQGVDGPCIKAGIDRAKVTVKREDG